ncbi:hypothetical protein ACHAWF_002233 [Thalassiosira exigua]
MVSYLRSLRPCETEKFPVTTPSDGARSTMPLRAFLVAALLFAGPASPSSPSGPSSRRGGGGAASSSPVRELGPSLAASVAGGTVVAARSPPRPPSSFENNGEALGDEEDDECLVVLFRSPVASGSSDAGNLTVASVFGRPAPEGDGAERGDEGGVRRHPRLCFLSDGPVDLPFLPGGTGHGLRVLHAPAGLLVAATGFAPDADHVLHVAAGRVLSRISLFDAPSTSSSAVGKSVDPHRLVREDLAAMMMDEAMSEGGRPYGVQLLVVGQSALSGRNGRSFPLEIYTIDPSGGWRSCVGRGAAVGRGAERVRSALSSPALLGPSQESETVKGNPSEWENVKYGWRGALERAMTATIDALEQEADSYEEDGCGEPTRDPRAKYGAVVVFGAPGLNSGQVRSSRCATIESAIVDKCYERCYRKDRKIKLAR